MIWKRLATLVTILTYVFMEIELMVGTLILKSFFLPPLSNKGMMSLHQGPWSMYVSTGVQPENRTRANNLCRINLN